MTNDQIVPWLAAAVRALPPDEQLLLALLYQEQLCEPEAARVLGLRLSVVQTRHQRLLARLRSARSASDRAGLG